MPKTKVKENKLTRNRLKDRVLAREGNPARLPDARPKIKKNISPEKRQVDGKDYESPNARPRSLNELWGFKGDKFGTTDEEAYQKKLSAANKADLQMMCIKIGLMPHDSRSIMTERLLKQFRQHVAALQSLRVKPKPIPTLTDKLRSVMGNLGGNTLV